MAAPTAPVMCFNGKMYYNTATYSTPTWVLIDNAGDIEVTDEATEVALQLRSMGGFEVYEPGLFKRSVAFKMVWDPADTKQDAIQTAYSARATVDLILLDQIQATAGSSGPRAVMKVFKCARLEAPIEGVMMLDVLLKPAYSSNAPSTYTAS